MDSFSRESIGWQHVEYAIEGFPDLQVLSPEVYSHYDNSLHVFSFLLILPQAFLSTFGVLLYGYTYKYSIKVDLVRLDLIEGLRS